MRYTIFFSILFASSGFSGQYILTKGTFSNGGGSSSSASYVLKDAGGQSVTGESKSTSYVEQAGFYTYSTIRVGTQEHKTEPLIPKVFSLSQNWPNPAIGKTMIRYGVPRVSHISIKAYDVTGRVVKTLIDCERKAGFYNLRWDGKSDQKLPLAQGIYFIDMRATDFRATRKLILLK